MSAARTVPGSNPEAPEVVAFRKQARGEALSDAERDLLATATRKPPADSMTVPHALVMAELAERERRGT
jgi:hypothetical protein